MPANPPISMKPTSTFQCWFMVFNATFNNISVISWRSVLLMEETEENDRPFVSNWQTLSHNVVSSTPRHAQVVVNTTTMMAPFHLKLLIMKNITTFVFFKHRIYKEELPNFTFKVERCCVLMEVKVMDDFILIWLIISVIN